MAFRKLFVAIAIVLLMAWPACPDEPSREYQVKAAFLFNFLKFVDWPAGPIDTPWVIGILGHDPFGDALDRAVRGNVVYGRPVEVRIYSRPADVKDCHILFIGRADFERLGAPVQAGLLTVGEAPGFLDSGGMVNFYLEDSRVHFEIRASVARAAGLRVSSQLMKLGKAL